MLYEKGGNTMNALEAAKKWDVTVARVYQYLKYSRIPGAVIVDGHWEIPAEEKKPKRLRQGRKTKEVL
jgi:hypothetical protein